MSVSGWDIAEFGRTVRDGMLHLVFPNDCWTCDETLRLGERLVCEGCRPQLTVDPNPACPRCSSTVGPHLLLDSSVGCPECRGEKFGFQRAFRIGPYEGILRKAIIRMKYRTGQGLADAMSLLWAGPMAQKLAGLKPDVIVPIPLHWMRRMVRGYNTCDFLGAALASELGVPCRTRLLRRVRATPPQVGLRSSTARKANVKRAFWARPDPTVAGKTIVLVDDVMTTGATASAAARALRRHRPKAVVLAVLAHGR